MSFPISGSGFNYAPITAGNGATVNNFKLEDGSTGLRAQNGDTITYDPSVQTAHNGIQSAVSAHIGNETLTKYGNGAATVMDERSGHVVSLDHGNLYSASTLSPDRVLLGSARSPEAWQKAKNHLGFGGPAASMLQDLEKTATLGISNAPTLQQNESEFGQSNAQGLDQLFGLLAQQAQALGGQSQSKADPLSILNELKQQIQHPKSGAGDQRVDPAVLLQVLAQVIGISLNSQPNK